MTANNATFKALEKQKAGNYYQETQPHLYAVNKAIRRWQWLRKLSMLLQLPHHHTGKQVIVQQAIKDFLNIRTNLMMTLPQNSAFTALGTTWMPL